MVKKILLLIICTMFILNVSFAQSQFSKTLSKIENSLFGIEYNTQSDEKRLSRIEEMIYGEKKSGDIKSRLAKLDKDASCNEMGCEIPPKRDTFDDDSDLQQNMNQGKEKIAQTFNEPEEKEDANIEYPAVNSLEMSAFGKEYKNLDIKTRLSNLEKKEFLKTYSNDDLSTRVERLKSKLAYKSNENTFEDDTINNFSDYSNLMADNTFPSDNYFSPKTINKNNSFMTEKQKEKYFDNQLADRDLRSKLNKIEKFVFKKSFTDDTTDNRLSRLESIIFNTNFSADSNNTRIKRIKAAADAQKTAKKYDSNSLSQKMAAAFQIGMLVLMVVAMIL